jgi:hypothetical protein
MKDDVEFYMEECFRDNIEKGMLGWLKLKLPFGDDIYSVDYADKQLSVQYFNRSDERDALIRGSVNEALEFTKQLATNKITNNQ